MKWRMRLEIVEKESNTCLHKLFRRIGEQHGGSAKSNFSFQFVDDNKGITEIIHTKFGLEMRDKYTYTLCTKCFENQQHYKDTLRISEIKAYEERLYALCVCYMFFLMLKENSNITASKGKAIPLQAWTGPESFRTLRPPVFNITASRTLKFYEVGNLVM
jgi:hypothetical protein